ncbi:MAG: DUF2878 domain-containing protein [Marinobacter sp.]|nr:DUF2878 domain-containing protein [Marinobacter sp.]
MDAGTRRNLANLVMFQTGWFLCVLFPGIATAFIGFGIVLAHLCTLSKRPREEFNFILMGTLLGTLLDGLWFQVGVMQDPASQVQWTPFWLVAIWALFMTTLSHSMAWLGQSRWLPWALAPLAGPFAYWSASKLGAVALPDLSVSLPALAMGWLVLFPLLLGLRKRFFPTLAVAP